MKHSDLYSNITIIVRPRAGAEGDRIKTVSPIILVCDDESDLRDLASEAIKGCVENCSVIEAKDGQEGVDKFLEYRPHIVLTDLHMPKMTGMEMTSKIRLYDKKTPIILMSGYADKNAVVDFMRLGANDVVDKPFNFQQLEASITKLLPELALEEVHYTVPQFAAITERFSSREVAEKSNPYQLVKIYNEHAGGIVSNVGIVMPSGEVVEVKSDFVPGQDFVLV